MRGKSRRRLGTRLDTESEPEPEPFERSATETLPRRVDDAAVAEGLVGEMVCGLAGGSFSFA